MMWKQNIGGFNEFINAVSTSQLPLFFRQLPFTTHNKQITSLRHHLQLSNFLIYPLVIFNVAI